MILLIGVVFFVARRVSGPITELQSVATNFEKGSYNQGRETLDRIEQRSDELGRFARSFSTMAREIRQREERLSEWNANLEKTVRDRTADLAQAMVKVEKANAKMSAELGEAATYSRAVLPERLTHPVRTDWVFVTSSELGGDSFGYHWLDDDTLSLYLLDVCGHGVGAALLSVSVVNVLRTSSLADTDFRDPAAVLGNLNAAFPMEKHNEMYFTAWYGIYKRSTGQMSYACGGHPPAVLVKPDGSHQHLSAKGAVVGVFPSPLYESVSVVVPEGSRLYLFSDGAYEIDRADGTMMTYEDLSQLLRTPAHGPKLDSIVTEVRRQQQREDFADDFSLVEFDFLKEPVRDPIDPSERSGHDTLILRNELAEIGRLHPFLKAYCEREGTPMEQVFDFEIILEELVTNVIKYGGLKPGEECCLIELIRSGNHLTIHFSDSGIPFNPLEQEEVDTSLPIEERPIGGLGIHFIKKLTDTQSYERREGRNVLTLTKTLRT
jgi:serine phosphatase RsbU (regulator of sigma subunit)/anti-sigma regulatory factor (Ser/Thr protein kinase)